MYFLNITLLQFCDRSPYSRFKTGVLSQGLWMISLLQFCDRFPFSSVVAYFNTAFYDRFSFCSSITGFFTTVLWQIYQRQFHSIPKCSLMTETLLQFYSKFKNCHCMTDFPSAVFSDFSTAVLWLIFLMSFYDWFPYFGFMTDFPLCSLMTDFSIVVLWQIFLV